MILRLEINVMDNKNQFPILWLRDSELMIGEGAVHMDNSWILIQIIDINPNLEGGVKVWITVK